MTSIIWPLGCARVWNRIKPVKCPALVYFYTKNSISENGKVTCFLLKTVLRLAPSPILDVSTTLTTIQLSWSADCWLCFYNTINHIDWLWCCGGAVFIYFYCYNPTLDVKLWRCPPFASWIRSRIICRTQNLSWKWIHLSNF